MVSRRASETSLRTPGAADVPAATYRLQFHAGFGFDRAAAVVPYLARLGVSHVYASPFLAARSGSTHGYDIVDHGRINPELGGEEGFERFSAALQTHGLGLIIDFVPNHVGIGGADNSWWLDVLEWGRNSPYARFFDIDWEPAEPSLRGKVLVPFLGAPYGDVLVRGEIAVRFDAATGSLDAWYFDHRLPLAPRHYAGLLKTADPGSEPARQALAEIASGLAGIGRGARQPARQAVLRRDALDLKARLAALAAEDKGLRTGIGAMLDTLNGEPGRPESFRALHRLLERQSYRLAYWRVATDEINYRRFFDINDLAGLRIEDPELFELSHGLVFRLLAEGKIHGIRLDHVDGLLDPAAYCRKLQERAAYVAPAATSDRPKLPTPVYLVVEKILAPHEKLREDWPVEGTTGYDFMVAVTGLMVDPTGLARLGDTYRRVTGDERSFEEVAVEARHQIVRYNLASEVTVLAGMLHRIAKAAWASRDYSLNALRLALIEVLAHFPVYRTYITADGTVEEDTRYIDWAVAQARRATGLLDDSIFDFVHAVLTGELRAEVGAAFRRREVRAAAFRFQQLSGPVAAKAIEDTAFYRWAPLAALNEVGAEPGREPASPAVFHALARDRHRRWPHAMLATATHDHKRGEDVRARLAVLSETPQAWARRIARWRRLNASKRSQLDDGPAPGPAMEWLLYQTLVGTWPLDGPDRDGRPTPELVERVAEYMLKAAREAKLRTNWARPDERYEAALRRFVEAVLDAQRSHGFLADLIDFLPTIEVAGALNGLVQAVLRLTTPGVPDTYQGAELWDLSLVDPDNRRPVDWASRTAALDDDRPAAELVPTWRDGRIKQRAIARLLACRQAHPFLFARGTYAPAEISGSAAAHVVAFWREHDGTSLTVVVPRLAAVLLGTAADPHVPAAAWTDTTVAIPNEAGATTAVDLFTGQARELAGGARVADLLGDFPVAALLATPPGA